MSLRIVPSADHPASFSHLPTAPNGAGSGVNRIAGAGAPSAPGLHDTLRAGVSAPSTASAQASASQPTEEVAAPVSGHPLESRLLQWEATQEQLRMETLRRAYGVAEPIRRGMELRIVRGGEWRPSGLASTSTASGGGSGMGSVHEDILKGKDESVTWDDVFGAGEELRGGSAGEGVHAEMERKLRM